MVVSGRVRRRETVDRLGTGTTTHHELAGPEPVQDDLD